MLTIALGTTWERRRDENKEKASIKEADLEQNRAVEGTMVGEGMRERKTSELTSGEENE